MAIQITKAKHRDLLDGLMIRDSSRQQLVRLGFNEAGSSFFAAFKNEGILAAWFGVQALGFRQRSRACGSKPHRFLRYLADPYTSDSRLLPGS